MSVVVLQLAYNQYTKEKIIWLGIWH